MPVSVTLNPKKGAQYKRQLGPTVTLHHANNAI